MQSSQYYVVSWSPKIEEGALDLLNDYKETSLFLLSNLEECGPTMGDTYYSGNYKCVVDSESSEVKSVFCLGRNGNLLLQTDRKDDYSELILDACLKEGIEIAGCLGEWQLANKFWDYYHGNPPIFRGKLE